MRVKISILFCFSIFFSQDSLKVVPAIHFKSSSLYEYYMGKHWRDLWTSQIDVEILRLKHFESPLKVYKEIRNSDSRTLLFVGENGQFYKFRSIYKDPKKLLSEEFQNSVLAEVVQDQISTIHPMASILSSEFLSAVGLFSIKAKLVVLDNDSNLGPFQREFANTLGTIENYFDFDENLKESHTNDIINSKTLFDRLQTNQSDKIDQLEYLKTRLMDIFLGDWDSQSEKWIWKAHKNEDRIIWTRISKNHDLAFSLFDGVFPYFGTIAVRQIESFEETYPDISNLTYSANNTDRRFLNQLTKTEWDSIALDIKQLLSDEVIENALKKMPGSFYKHSANYIRNALIKRRDNLLEAAEDYYSNIMEYARLYGTSKREYVEVIRNDDASVDVRMYSLSESAMKNDQIFYRRYFENETKEIRIILDEGDDIVHLSGDVDESIDVIIDGGNGVDEYIDKSKGSSNLLNLITFNQFEKKTIIYDSDENSKITKSSLTKVNSNKYKRASSIDERYQISYRDYGYKLLYEPSLSYNLDDGLIFGLGPVLYSHDYLSIPYSYRMSLIPSYSTKADAYKVEFSSSFLDLIHDAEVTIDFNITEFDINRFYGFGNESKLIFDEDNNFYQVGNRRSELRANVIYRDKKWLRSIGTSWLHSKVEELPNTLLDTLNIIGEGISQLSGFHTGLAYNNVREKNEFYKHGFSFQLEFGFYPKLINNDYRFEELKFEFKTYYPISQNIIQATRIFLDIKSGRIPFFKTAFLGHSQLLRGFTKDRFSGKSLVVGNYEIRSHLVDANILIPTKIGFNVFADFGRVYIENERSNKIHKSFGSGIWISIMNNTSLINVTVAASEESTELNLTTRFNF